MVPSDWEANNAHGPNNPATVSDWEAALDVTVLKKGIFTFIFHPHGWIRPEQLVEFIDYATQKYGRRVKFLNFREVQDRLDRNLLLGQPLRAANGRDNGVRLLDLNKDGCIDVIIGNAASRKTRLWNPKADKWTETDFPVVLAAPERAGDSVETGVRFGVVRADGRVSALIRNETGAGAWSFDGSRWVEDTALLNGLELDGVTIVTSVRGRDQGVRFRDVDNDGRCELIVSNEKQNAIFAWSDTAKSWKKLSYSLPVGSSIVDEQGRDNGLRFVDVNNDGYDDVLFSNGKSFALHLFIATPKPWLGWERGWTFKVVGGRRGDPGEIPMIVRGGTNLNNGVWFHAKQMFVQNEETADLPDKVDVRSFAGLLSIAEAPPKSPAESLAAIRVRPGFKVELVANEPLVIDPVAFDWGPDGKFWVVEMRDYPSGLDGHGKSGGIIKYLEDTNGDGRYDKATVFLENVNFPNGIMVWRKGVLISAAPEIFYAEDTDGDGKADVRKPILVGFNQGNQQHRVNGFEYGLDNWVYAANGGSGGTIKSMITGK
ncbi:MAG TPA: PVC-type heme-binding CxxCH protein, partial [Candidatus Binatia bacterium]|nr:PVC-type heme-binding CxxCH protein [Candidatus Binatia bacterium]